MAPSTVRRPLCCGSADDDGSRITAVQQRGKLRERGPERFGDDEIVEGSQARRRTVAGPRRRPLLAAPTNRVPDGLGTSSAC